MSAQVRGSGLSTVCLITLHLWSGSLFLFLFFKVLGLVVCYFDYISECFVSSYVVFSWLPDLPFELYVEETGASKRLKYCFISCIVFIANEAIFLWVLRSSQVG